MKNFYITQLKKESKYFYTFTALAICTPIVLFFLPWIPEGETAGSWFQISGSAMVVFALLAEARAVNVYNILNPSDFVDMGFDKAREQFGKHPVKFNFSSFILIVLGTFIWGYGYLPF